MGGFRNGAFDTIRKSATCHQITMKLNCELWCLIAAQQELECPNCGAILNRRGARTGGSHAQRDFRARTRLPRGYSSLRFVQSVAFPVGMGKRTLCTLDIQP